jgi:N-methylhydantoinase B
MQEQPYSQTDLDATSISVMANRLDSITREMANTVVRTARSTTMAARDFSCCIVSADHELLSSPEGMPAHVFGMGPSARSMVSMHPEFKEGDAFLHNDPYMGNSHAADHQILVPVFFGGEHIFTACTKAHQVDVGNALPTTYMPMARDVYEEGALIFPCVKIQQDYQDVADVIRMCERRIRGFEIWYGDYLAQLGAVRLAERRLHEFCLRFGLNKVRSFVREWLDYSERVTADAIRRLPAGEIHGHTQLDPFPGVPEGLHLRVRIEVDPVAAEVTVDLRDNPDCVPAGLNLTESTATNGGVAGVLCVLNSRKWERPVIIPNNSGSFRRIRVLLRENCVVGIPKHPVSCSLATNTVADRVHGMILHAFTQLGEDIGLAEPCYGSPPFMGVASGYDRRRDAFYIMQIASGTAGGPASPTEDGWLMLLLANAAGMAYMDSTEVQEQKNPLLVWQKEVRIDSEGSGVHRGAPGNVCIYGPRFDPMQVHYFLEGVMNPPKGARGGGSASGPWVGKISGRELLAITDVIGQLNLGAGESTVSLSAGGGGHGSALKRSPAAVLEDAREGYISIRRAQEVYGVILTGDPQRFETLQIDTAATERLRASTEGGTAHEDEWRQPVVPQPWWTECVDAQQPAGDKL